MLNRYDIDSTYVRHHLPLLHTVAVLPDRSSDIWLGDSRLAAIVHSS